VPQVGSGSGEEQHTQTVDKFCRLSRSGSRCLINRVAQGSRPIRLWAFKDAVLDTWSSVDEPVHPTAVQLGVQLTDSPPFGLKECVHIKSRFSF
jgi:hypothetical protein